MIYSEAEVQKVAVDAMAIRSKLQQRELPIYGNRVKVIGPNGKIHEDIARVARKDKLDKSDFQGTPAGKATDSNGEVPATGDFKTYELLQKYLKQVNTVDFVTNDHSVDAGNVATRLRDALAQVHALERRQDVDGERIETLLTKGLPQQDTAAETKFFGRAARSRDRIVFNADIRDLGLDVIEANASTMSKVARGTSVDDASRATSDRIVERKRKLAEELGAFYRDVVLPRVASLAQTRPEVAHALASEPTPLFLLGGDEITVSIPRVFGEAGVTEMLVGFLSRHNARVAVTRSGTGDARHGHIAAMKAAENAHDVLKTIEETNRKLERYAHKMDAGSLAIAKRLRATFANAYTETDTRGATVVKASKGSVVDQRQLDLALKLVKEHEEKR